MKNGVIQYKINNDDCEPELIVINLPRSFNSEYLSYTGIEEVKDMCFYSGKYEGGQVVGNCPHLIIFANSPLDPTFKQQMALLQESFEVLIERDVMVVVDTSPNSKSILRKNLRPKGFVWVLIGKDGTVKLRKHVE